MRVCVRKRDQKMSRIKVGPCKCDIDGVAMLVLQHDETHKRLEAWVPVFETVREELHVESEMCVKRVLYGCE